MSGHSTGQPFFIILMDKKKLAEAKFKELQPSLGRSIATELVPYTEFYDAEGYHQDYEKKNPYQPYIVSVSKPKIDQVAEEFKQLLKEKE